MKRLTHSPNAAKATYRIHMLLKELENACLAANFWFSGRPCIKPTLAPAAPPPKADAVWGPRTAASCDCLDFIWFWKMTDPTTTDIADPRLRVKPKVAVAVAMSRFCWWWSARYQDKRPKVENILTNMRLYRRVCNTTSNVKMDANGVHLQVHCMSITDADEREACLPARDSAERSVELEN